MPPFLHSQLFWVVGVIHLVVPQVSRGQCLGLGSPCRYGHVLGLPTLYSWLPNIQSPKRFQCVTKEPPSIAMEGMSSLRKVCDVNWFLAKHYYCAISSRSIAALFTLQHWSFPFECWEWQVWQKWSPLVAFRHWLLLSSFCFQACAVFAFGAFLFASPNINIQFCPLMVPLILKCLFQHWLLWLLHLLYHGYNAAIIAIICPLLILIWWPVWRMCCF